MEKSAAYRQYEEEGYVVFRNVLDDPLKQESQAHIEFLMNKHPDVRPEKLTTHNIVDDPFWIRLVSDERLLAIAQQFLGPNLALFGAHYFCKMPFTGKPVLWHQDGSYWPLEPMEVVTLWLAIDRSIPENGCLRVIPRTHKLELQEMQTTEREENILDSEVDPALVDESRMTSIILDAGDVSVHHPNIIHGSEANHSPYRRCGMAIRYISTSTKVLKKEFPLYHLRGNLIEGINQYRPIPKFNAAEHMNFVGYEAYL
ncbi:MAG: phytanoyl-CoA dioxygenase family protein [Paenibacillus sp.]|jgi:ectoine hydroxylase-related dioxygenase (phytanoyl-CoA dioxygenase family)|nr:phytanoyl-CoA dioxygenase family protein [Paenibacillus sp.]